MRIEIDTKHDTKEELAHLANMLKALSGSSGSGSTLMSSRLDRKLAKRGLIQSAASEPAPSGDLFNLFNDDASSPAEVPQASQPAPSGTADLFSLFGSEPPVHQAAPLPSQPAQQSVASPTVADLLSGRVPLQDSDEDDSVEGKTSVKDILEDDRIVPY